MSQKLATFRLLAVSAARSVVSHRMKSLIVGFILMFGTALLVIGTSLLDSVQQSMQKTVTESLAGHLQVYSADAESDLALFGDVVFGGNEIAEVEDFARIRAPIEALDNVRAVVPMGITEARFVIGNRIDEVIGQLREAVDQQDAQAIRQLKAQLQEMAANLRDENQARAQIAADPKIYEAHVAAMDHVLSEEFWATELAQNPQEALLFLDTDMAPLASDGQLIFMRVLGTDPQKFAQYFDRFRIVEGQMIPRGEHGILISHQAWEKWLKNRIAHELDALKKELHKEKRRIADDELLQTDVNRMVDQYRRVVFGLPPAKIARVKEKVRAFLGSDSDDERELLREFLRVNDANFDARYDFFYAELAPIIRLHEFEPGEYVTLQAFNQRGFPQSTNIKVWGTFGFKGLEDTDIAGSVNMVDLPTFRTLYGVMSAEGRAELEAIRESVGVQDLRRDEAEDALFGDDSDVFFAEDAPTDDAQASDAPTDDAGDDAAGDALAAAAAPTNVDLSGPTHIAQGQTYDPTQLERGLVRNAAVILKDPMKLEETRAALKDVIKAENLHLNVLDWQEAAGIVGQFVIVIRLVLYVAITIIFLVALVIINNSMVMATVERTAEIGTMRAIGAQRWYVMVLFLLETVILGLMAGLVGCALGATTIALMHHWGLPATTNFLQFLFAGERLHPTLSLGNMLWGLGAIVGISVISTLYPARLATRIQPIVAMRQ